MDNWNYDNEGRLNDDWDIFQTKTDGQAKIISMYFAMTSLSTVGFGDYYPQSTAERAGCTVVFLIVIVAWPVLVNALIDALMKLTGSFEDPKPYDELNMFFAVIERYN